MKVNGYSAGFQDLSVLSQGGFSATALPNIPFDDPGPFMPGEGNGSTIPGYPQPNNLCALLQQLVAALSQLNQQITTGYPGGGAFGAGPSYSPASPVNPSMDPQAVATAQNNSVSEESNLSANDQNYLSSVGNVENTLGLTGAARTSSVIDSLEQGFQSGQFSDAHEIQAVQDYYDANYLGIDSNRYANPITAANLPAVRQGLAAEEKGLLPSDHDFLTALSTEEKTEGLTGEVRTRSTVEQLQTAFQEGRFHDANYVKLFEDSYDAQWLQNFGAGADYNPTVPSAQTPATPTSAASPAADTAPSTQPPAQQPASTPPAASNKIVITLAPVSTPADSAPQAPAAQRLTPHERRGMMGDDFQDDGRGPADTGASTTTYETTSITQGGNPLLP